MSVARKTPQATYQDVLDAPEGVIAELVDGELYLQAQPAPRHGDIQDGLVETLRPPFHRGRGGPGGWLIRGDPELHFGDNSGRVLVPDLAGWRRERLAALPPSWRQLRIVPDWVCEILSPSTRSFDLLVKRPAYAGEGVRHLWLVDPEPRTIEAFELRDGAWSLLGAWGGDQTEAAIPPFDAIALPLMDLWPESQGDE